MSQSKIFSIVKKAIVGYDFPEFVWVYCRPTVADMFKPDQRCGIYILRFRDNQFYVGQAVDVIRRFVQHSKVHDDIQEISFKIFNEKDLNRIEQELVKSLEKKEVKLRNINLTSIPKGDTDLDLLIPYEQQQFWLTANYENKLNEHFIEQPNLQEKYFRKYQRLSKRNEFSESARPF